MVERQFQQGGGDIHLTFEHGHFIFVEHVIDDVAQHRRAMRGHFRRFDHGGAARRDGRDQRHQGQVDRVIPRRDDQRDALGLITNTRFGAEHQHGRPYALAAHPLADVADGVLDLGQNRGDFGQIHFHRRFFEVGVAGLLDGVLTGQDRVAQLLQLGHALGFVGAAQRQSFLLLQREHALDVSLHGAFEFGVNVLGNCTHGFLPVFKRERPLTDRSIASRVVHHPDSMLSIRSDRRPAYNARRFSGRSRGSPATDNA